MRSATMRSGSCPTPPGAWCCPTARRARSQSTASGRAWQALRRLVQRAPRTGRARRSRSPSPLTSRPSCRPGSTLRCGWRWMGERTQPPGTRGGRTTTERLSTPTRCSPAMRPTLWTMTARTPCRFPTGARPTRSTIRPPWSCPAPQATRGRRSPPRASASTPSGRASTLSRPPMRTGRTASARRSTLRSPLARPSTSRDRRRSSSRRARPTGAPRTTRAAARRRSCSCTPSCRTT